MLKSQKASVIEALTGEMETATSVIVTDYRGLSTAQLRRIRNDLRPLNASYAITKNTLARIAARNAGKEGLDELLVGPSAVAFVRGDVAAVAKKLSDIARDTRILALKSAWVEGTALDEDGVKKLATLPPKEQVQANVVGILAAPLQGVVSLLAAAPRELVVVIDQIIQKKQAEAA